VSFPPYVETREQRRRWELVVRAALIAFGWDPDDPRTTFDHLDRLLLQRAVQVLYADESMDTGDGEITGHQRLAMQAMGVL
jgi:hypothetical protein